MADIVDIVNEQDFVGNAVAKARLSIETRTEIRTGACKYCEEPIEVGIFCNPVESDCRDLWEHEQRLLRINGR